MSKTKKVWIIVAVCCVVVGLALSVLAFAKMGFRISGLNTTTLTTNMYYADEPFSNIEIKDVESDILLLSSQDGTCHVECTESDAIKHQVYVIGDTLTVERTDTRKWYERIGFFWGDMCIKVYLPEKVYEKLDVTSVSGDICVSDDYADFIFGEAVFHTTSGAILFDNVAQNGLSAQTVSGDICVLNVHGPAVDLKSTSGDIRLSDIQSDALTIKTTSGDIRLGTHVLISGPLTIDTTSGDMQLDACDAESLRLDSVSGDIVGTLLSEKHFTVHTTSGDVHVDDTPTARQTCQVSTTSGDVHIMIEGRTD